MNKNDLIHEPNDREIDMMLNYVAPYSEMNAKNIKDKFTAKAKKQKKPLSLKKMIIIGIAATMMLLTTLVYAEIIDLSYIYTIIFGENSHYIEPYIEPLAPTNTTMPKDPNTSPSSIESEYDGIVFKLISAINDENELRIFATVTDTKGDRLGDSLDFASWGLSQGHGGNLNVVDYNSETKTAIIMITSLGSDHHGEVTLTVNDFSIGREFLEGLPENQILITSLLQNHTPKTLFPEDVWIMGGGGDFDRFRNSRLLQYDAMAIPFLHTDTFTISNVGFIDGKLHIQTKAFLDEVSASDGYYIDLKFVNAMSEVVYEPAVRMDFIADKKYAYAEHATKPHQAYSEMIFDTVTTPEQLNGLSLTIDYMKSPKITQGNWAFSFTVPEKITTTFDINRTLPINGEQLTVESISLSPLGITMHLPVDLSDGYTHTDTASVTYKDGSQIPLLVSSLHTYEGGSTLTLSGDLIQVERVGHITINNEKITIAP